MNHLERALKDPYLWVAVVSALGALVAAVFAWVSARAAKRSLELAEKQDQRRTPRLVLYLIDGYCQRIGSTRFLAFSVSVSNHSDIDNSVAQIELQVSYTTAAPTKGFCMAVKVPHRSALADRIRHNATILSPPLRIDAHQTIAGWVLFEVGDVLIGNGKIDDYAILVSDSHGQACRVEQAIVRELADEGANDHNRSPRSA